MTTNGSRGEALRQDQLKAGRLGEDGEARPGSGPTRAAQGGRRFVRSRYPVATHGCQWGQLTTVAAHGNNGFEGNLWKMKNDATERNKSVRGGSDPESGGLNTWCPSRNEWCLMQVVRTAT